MTAAENTLKIGDFVSLKVQLYGAYMSAEGILSDDVRAEESVAAFEDHIFQIYIQMQYSASNEYEEFKEHYQGDVSTIEDTSTLKHLTALRRGKENESMLNDMFFAAKTGNEISFGDVIQLRHTRSGKFLTVIGSELAKEERENVRVGLNPDGNVNSWIKVLPRFKIDRLGSPITSNTEILLKVDQRSPEYIHCTDKVSTFGHSREINSAMENGTSFRICVYHRVVDVFNEKLLLTGQLICITDPETKSYLTVFQQAPEIDMPKGILKRLKPPPAIVDEGVSVISGSGDEEYEQGVDVPQISMESSLVDEEGTVTSLQEHLNEFGDVVLQPAMIDKFDTNAIWVLETPTVSHAGSITWKTDKTIIRHLNTGKYLTIKSVSNDPVHR